MTRGKFITPFPEVSRVMNPCVQPWLSAATQQVPSIFSLREEEAHHFRRGAGSERYRQPLAPRSVTDGDGDNPGRLRPLSADH